MTDRRNFPVFIQYEHMIGRIDAQPVFGYIPDPAGIEFRKICRSGLPPGQFFVSQRLPLSLSVEAGKLIEHGQFPAEFSFQQRFVACAGRQITGVNIFIVAQHLFKRPAKISVARI